MANGMHEIEAAPEPRKESFTEAKLPNEPQSDVRVTASSGMVLRERVKKIEHAGGITLAFTYTRLDENGNVMLTDNGEPIIAPTHEVALLGQNMVGLSPQDINDSLREGRKIGTAFAVDYFNGIEALSNIMLERLQ